MEVFFFAPDWCDGNKLQVEWEKDSSIYRQVFQ